MSTSLTAKRLLDFRAQPPQKLEKAFPVLLLDAHLARRHGFCGWPGDMKLEAQAQPDFIFDARLFSLYLEKVLKLRANKIYFPVAYTGKVAKSLSDAGYDVHASDISPDWVAHMKKLGLNVEQRSVEQFPDAKFDAVVTFEPYTVCGTIEGYLAVLETLSRELPFIMIRTRGPFLSITRSTVIKLVSEAQHLFDQVYPIGHDSMFRIAYDYGARYDAYIAYGHERDFSIASFLPKPLAVENARFDLQVLNALQAGFSSPELSLSALAQSLGRRVEDVAGSLARLYDVLVKRLGILDSKGLVLQEHIKELRLVV